MERLLGIYLVVDSRILEFILRASKTKFQREHLNQKRGSLNEDEVRRRFQIGEVQYKE